MSITVPKNPFVGMAKQLDINVAKALDKSGDILIKESQKRVPVRTGVLKRSLDYIVTKVTNGWRLTYGSGVRAGDEVPYAKYQEFGTKYIAPVKYLRNSRDFKEKKIMSLISTAIRKAIKV